MTTTYQAEDRSCIECGEDVQDYTGHWEASEVTLCEGCYDEYAKKWEYRAEVIHKVPLKDDKP